jgi:hypothetical protein
MRSSAISRSNTLLPIILAASFVVWLRVFYLLAWILNFTATHDALLQSVLDFQHHRMSWLLIPRMRLPLYERIGLALTLIGVLFEGYSTRSILRATLLGCAPVLIPAIFYAIVLGDLGSIAPLTTALTITFIGFLFALLQKELIDRGIAVGIMRTLRWNK